MPDGGATARKTRSPSRRAAAKAAGGRTRRRARGRSELLTLSEVGRRTGISYPTLLRYVRLHLAEIPHEGEGRGRRYRPEAVDVFRRLRAASPRGRRSTRETRARSASELRALERRIAALERGQRRLETALRDLLRELRRPLRLTVRR